MPALLLRTAGQTLCLLRECTEAGSHPCVIRVQNPQLESQRPCTPTWTTLFLKSWLSVPVRGDGSRGRSIYTISPWNWAHRARMGTQSAAASASDRSADSLLTELTPASDALDETKSSHDVRGELRSSLFVPPPR